MSEPLDIPDKLYFRIGDVAALLGVRPHVLRYWETEFPSLRPEKSRTNQRLYQRRDIELLAEVKRLLYDEGFTIAGARKRLRRGGRAGAADPAAAAPQTRLQSGDGERIRGAALATADPAAPQAAGPREGGDPAAMATLDARCGELERALADERAAHRALRERLREELEDLRSFVRREAEGETDADGA